MAMKQVELALDTVRRGVAEAIATQLIELKSKTGNTYYGLAQRSEPLIIEGLQGSLNVSWNDLKPAGDVAAATVERVQAAVARMSPEQKREWLEAELAKL